MVLADIHSHILPDIDDGAKDIDQSIKLLNMMKEQNITDVVATPHFYAGEDSLEVFLENRENAYNSLLDEMKGLDLPKIHLGAEVLYFDGMDKSESLNLLTLGKSNFILLELANAPIKENILKTITNLSNNLDLTVIMAHIERYSRQKGFKNLLKLVEDGIIYAQVNAHPLTKSCNDKTSFNLLKENYVSFVATDAHSPDLRPPHMNEALEMIESVCGKEIKDTLVSNSEEICNIIADN